MTYYADLGPIDYFRDLSFPALRAVGWLGPSYPYQQGEVRLEFFERLCVLLLDPWDPVMFRGSHECELCSWEVPPASEDSMALEEELMRTLPPGEERSTRFRELYARMGGIRRRPEPIRVGDQVLSMGQLNLFVPGEGCVYVAPSLIAHYIRTHGYAPPGEFVEAVLQCPEMHSEEYLKARRDLPKSEFWDWLWQCPEPRSEEYREALRASGAEKLANWIPWHLRDGTFKGSR